MAALPRPDEPAAPPAAPAPSPAADYRRRAEAHATERDVARGVVARIAHFRLGAFLLAAIGGLTILFGNAPAGSLTGALTLLAALAFVALVAMHGRARRRAEWAEARRQLCEDGEARVLRAWDRLPPRAESRAPADHAYAGDLDVEGHASLAALLDVASGPFGRPTARRWLLEQQPPPDAATITARQDAVASLAGRVEWREELSAHARLVGPVTPAAVAQLLAWAEGEPWLLRRPAVLWAARLLPPLVIAASLVAISETAYAEPARPVAGVLMLASSTLAFFVRSRTRDALDLASARAEALRRQVTLFAHAATVRGEGQSSSALLAELQARLVAGGPADRALARLGHVAGWAETRQSPLFYLLLQAFVAWDAHVAAALERWQRDSGRRVRDWLAALGELEALSAFATLAHDNPTWSFPTFRDDDNALLSAHALGHPLIPDAVRVANDVHVGPRGTLLLVTGSNMSGKSTLLRAIGLNTVLAQAGGPVCAARLTLPRVRLWTSVRIQDSLEQGMSLFMAELQRLKRIVDAARAARDVPVLFLLDEMLHGTNTAERRVAARIVLGHLLASGGIGAITTHDVHLAEDDALAGAAHPVHFTESFRETEAGPSMTFDYRLRPGIATSVNALKLLRLVGLSER